MRSKRASQTGRYCSAHVEIVFEWRGVERARPVLGALTPRDQAGPFEHLDVLGDGRKRQLEGLGELVDVRFALGEPGQDRSTRRVGQRGEGLVEPILVNGQAHDFTS